MKSVAAIVAAIVAITGVVAASPAQAARRSFAWLWDSDVVPERTVELEWWVTEQSDDDLGDTAVLTVSTVFGLTDNLEIAIPVDASYRSSSNQTQFQDYGLELRWRLASADPAKAPPVVPLVRVAVARLLQIDAARIDVNAILSADLVPRLRLVADLDGYVVTSGPSWYLAGGVGASFALIDDLRVGAELYGVKTLESERREVSWLSLGPNVSYTHGRFWITAAIPIGLGGDAPRILPRIVWATAF
jgi:hypothetical protein